MIKIFTKEKKQEKKQEKTKVGYEIGSLMRKLAIMGVIIIGGISLYSYAITSSILVPMMLIGAFGFAPLGMILGAVVIDKHLRCKLFRAMFKRNIGIVNIIDGKDKYSRLKDFDHDIIESKNGLKIYHLKKGKIYSDKGEAIGNIDQDSVKFTSGVPEINFDINDMIPLSLHKEDTSINAEQMAAIIKAHTIIQESKLLGRVKKGAIISVFVLIAVMGVSVYYAYSAHSMLQNDVIPLLQSLKTATVITQGG